MIFPLEKGRIDQHLSIEFVTEAMVFALKAKRASIYKYNVMKPEKRSATGYTTS